MRANVCECVYYDEEGKEINLSETHVFRDERSRGKLYTVSR